LERYMYERASNSTLNQESSDQSSAHGIIGLPTITIDCTTQPFHSRLYSAMHCSNRKSAVYDSAMKRGWDARWNDFAEAACRAVNAERAGKRLHGIRYSYVVTRCPACRSRRRKSFVVRVRPVTAITAGLRPRLRSCVAQSNTGNQGETHVDANHPFRRRSQRRSRRIRLAKRVHHWRLDRFDVDDRPCTRDRMGSSPPPVLGSAAESSTPRCPVPVQRALQMLVGSTQSSLLSVLETSCWFRLVITTRRSIYPRTTPSRGRRIRSI
jgi:hypothetical protein